MEELILPHGGYRRLKSFQTAQLVYDLTVRFVELYVDARSRTRDQMVQAARSGVQNIAEGSQASGTSKKTELKLTSVGRASLEELKLDYEDFLRQRGVPVWDKAHPVILRFREAKVADIAQFRAFLSGLSDESGTSGLGRSALVAQLLISLVNQSCLLLDRQLARLAADFEHTGGFSERLTAVRRAVRGFPGRDSK